MWRSATQVVYTLRNYSASVDAIVDHLSHLVQLLAVILVLSVWLLAEQKRNDHGIS